METKKVTITEFAKANERTIYFVAGTRSVPILEWFDDGEAIEVIEPPIHNDKPDEDFTIWLVNVDGEPYGYLVDDTAGCYLLDPDEYPVGSETLKRLTN